MTFTCTHCNNDDPDGVYVESEKVSGVCTDCVHNEWVTCESCGDMIGPDDDHDLCDESVDYSVKAYEGGLAVWG